MKMYDNILQKVALYEEKKGISYAKTDGKLYKTLDVIYILVFAYSVVMNLFFMLGMAISDRLRDTFGNALYTVLGLSVAMIAALVISRFKSKILANIISAVLNVFSAVALVLTFAPLMEGVAGGYNAAFYWRHFAPLCVLVVLSIIICVIAVRANLKVQKNYKKIVENIYNAHSVSAQESNFTAEEWEEILKSI